MKHDAVTCDHVVTHQSENENASDFHDERTSIFDHYNILVFDRFTMALAVCRRYCLSKGFSAPLRATSRLYHELSYTYTGDPSKVLHYHQTNTQRVHTPSHHDSVCVRMKHAPWNPADMNSIQGRYASPYCDQDFLRGKSLYFDGRIVAGSEGWGQVMAADESNMFEEGDWVTMGLPGFGTFRSHLCCEKDALIRIRRGRELFEAQGPRAATLFQLGGTAYRMLHDFVSLESPSDTPRVIVQNAGNSGVGFMASQLSSLVCSNTKMVSLVRRNNRSQQDFDELVEYLKVKGKNHRIIAEEDLIEAEDGKTLKAELGQLGEVVLALNAVGGRSSDLLFRLLGKNAVHVTYGGMSMKPVTVSTSQLIFSNVETRGYWHSRWMVQNMSNRTTKEKMINELVGLVLSHDLACPMVEVMGLSQALEAISRHADQANTTFRRKTVFDCGEDA